MNGRDELLGRLRAKQRPAADAPVWRSERAFPDLAERFCAMLRAAGGEPHRVPDRETAVRVIDDLLWEASAKCVALNGDAEVEALALPARFPEIAWRLVGRDPGDDLRAFCATAEVGIGGCLALIAETGTAVVAGSGAGRSRLAILLPPMHIVVAPLSALTTDLFAWTAARSGALPANLTLISGPSKSADIGQTLAVGVHGPGRFVVILVG